MSRKFIFFDIDGTLYVTGYGRGYVPESAKLALKKLRENGHFVALATGRSHAMAEDTMVSLGLENMVHDGGNGITIDGKVVEIEPLDRDLCLELIEECKEKNFLWAITPGDEKCRLAPDERFYEFTHDRYLRTEVVPGLDPESFDKFHKLYIACFKPEEEKLETLKKLPWCRFDREYLFVEPNDKSIGIKRIVDHFGGEYKDVFVFGDQRNDLSMFRDEWTSIAMGNAVPELKEKADYVTTDCDKDGIYNACVHFGLI